MLVSGAYKTDLGLTAGLYFSFIGIWFVLFLNGLIKKNRPLSKAYGTGCKGNNALNLLIGYLIGIGMNGAAILMAWMHGDIKMYFDKFELIPFVILFIAVFVQSAAEEMVCRGFIYQRVLRTYRDKFWLAVLVNSVFFGLIHLRNEGISALAVVDLVVTGLLFNAMVYYFDSLWMAMAAHAGWNFTQSILAGLPNSGNVVPYSVFKLDAATARDSFFYNVAFGVEGTIPAIAIQVVVLVALVAIGIKLGGKPTDIWAGEEA
jgi:membrane protease YdiL (CAAX protease family)